MNLLEDYKTEIASAMKNVFDTYKRQEPFIFYKPSEEEIVILDPEFNADLQEFDSVGYNLTEQSQSFYCRVIFPRREKTYQTSISNISVPIHGEQDLGEVYLQMEEDAFLYIKDAVRFTFMGENYQKLSAVRKLGFLDNFTLYQIYLKRVN
jgi:hypothetical protein